MKISTWVAIVLTLALFVGGTWAEDQSGQLVRFKAGEVELTILQSDGVSPMANAEIKALSPEDASVLAEAEANRLGRAVLALEEGRYLLNVAGLTLSVLDVAHDADLSVLRVVMPDADMLVAGQQQQSDSRDPMGFYYSDKKKYLVVGGVALLLAGAVWAGYEWGYSDSKDKRETVEVPVPGPVRVRTRTREVEVIVPVPVPVPSPL